MQFKIQMCLHISEPQFEFNGKSAYSYLIMLFQITNSPD